MAITSRTDRIVRNMVRRTAVRIDRGTGVVTNVLQFKEERAVGANVVLAQVMHKDQFKVVELATISVPLLNVPSLSVLCLAARISALLRTKRPKKSAKVVSVNWSEIRV